MSSCASNRHDHPPPPPPGTGGKISQKRRHDKYGVSRVGSIRSLAPIPLVKSGLHFGRFAFSYNPKFHCVKSPPANLILRPTLYR